MKAYLLVRFRNITDLFRRLRPLLWHSPGKEGGRKQTARKGQEAQTIRFCWMHATAKTKTDQCILSPSPWHCTYSGGCRVFDPLRRPLVARLGGIAALLPLFPRLPLHAALVVTAVPPRRPRRSALV